MYQVFSQYLSISLKSTFLSALLPFFSFSQLFRPSIERSDLLNCIVSAACSSSSTKMRKKSLFSEHTGTLARAKQIHVYVNSICLCRNFHTCSKLNIAAVKFLHPLGHVKRQHISPVSVLSCPLWHGLLQVFFDGPQYFPSA